MTWPGQPSERCPKKLYWKLVCPLTLIRALSGGHVTHTGFLRMELQVVSWERHLQESEGAARPSSMLCAPACTFFPSTLTVF